MENLNNKTEKMTLKEFYQSREWTCYCSMDKVVYEYRMSEDIKYTPELHVTLKEELKAYFVELERPQPKKRPEYLVSFINRLGGYNV